MRNRVFSLTAGVLLLAALASASIATMASAQTPQPMKDKIIGGWKLAAVIVDGKAPYGADPKGSLLLTFDGHFSLIVVGAGTVPTEAIFGTYKVNEADGSVLLHVNGGTEASIVGHEAARKIILNGDAMTVEAMGPTAGTSGMSFKRGD